MRMTRRITFSASHINWLNHKTEAENLAIFGSSTNPEPTGHNYTLDVTVSGSVNERTGIIVNIKEIDQIVRVNVLQMVDHRLLNGPLGPLAGTPATGEMLLELIRGWLGCRLPDTVTLCALRLEMTPLDVIEWKSEENKEKTNRMRSSGVTLATRVYEFSSSHRLNSDALSEQENIELFGKCNYANGHGHNYVLEVTVEGPISTQTGRVIGPETLDEIVNREVVERYDHRNLNLDIPEFEGLIPSSEVITKKMWELLVKHILPPARLYRLLLRETARNFFEYCGED
jgi:6-pyruvoyltetrahydropterin/6-carboxytetrahydropterin synthase